MKKNSYLIVVLFSGLWSSVYAWGLFGNDVGVGARALAFAGNHTAVVNDLSATYWNPAALAFMPVREFQISLDGRRTYVSSDHISGLEESDYRDRIRLGSIGFLSAIPTVQGGLTLAAAYDNPHTFDDFSVYKYKLSDGSVMKVEDVTFGGLNNWSGSFGVQAAKGLSAGATISLITGTERAAFSEEEVGVLDDALEYELECKYMGFGIRGGLIYLPMENLRLGMQISAAQSLRFKEKETMTGQKTVHGDGRVYRAPSGAIGAGIKLPWMMVALDGRFTMPYTFTLPSEKIPSSSQARYFKLGGGLGLEVPLSMAPVVLRGGYSYDEYDLFSRVLKYDDEKIDWTQRYNIDKNRHTITGGVGIFTSGTGIEFSYGYETWALSTINNRLKQDYSAHRMAVAFIVRY